MRTVLPNPTKEQLQSWIEWAERTLAMPDKQLREECRYYLTGADAATIRATLENDLETWQIYLEAEGR